jgi:hypothetical protein
LSAAAVVGADADASGRRNDDEERQDRVAGERINGAAVSAQDGRREASEYHTSRRVASAGHWDSWESWNERSRIVLSPVAAPSILRR